MKPEPKGYTWDCYHKAWKVRVTRNGKRIHVAYCQSRKIAEDAYRAICEKMSGECEVQPPD